FFFFTTMKFGYYIRTPLNYPEIRDLTIKVEKLGFDKKEPYLESMMLLAALGTETKKVKVKSIIPLIIDKFYPF
ncbi:MAG: hypothetical protein ACFFBC_15230, partial [Promethearchaeota archaeon]